MRYQGSKAKIAKHFLPIITKHLNGENWYFEPFVGGCNVIDKIPYNKKVGMDINPCVISMWDAFKRGILPPKEVSKGEYDRLKHMWESSEPISSDIAWLIGYVGNACSYGSSWFNGYAKYNEKKKENHILEAYNGTIKQIKQFKNLNDTGFICTDYSNDSVYPPKSVIYCDPPYMGTKGYGSNFDHEAFWAWVRKMSKEGHYVYVSEYTAPTDFKCVWSMERPDGMGTTIKGRKQNKKIEKLFVYDGKY